MIVDEAELDPTAGNRKLLEELRGYEDRLSPSLAILPCVTDREYVTFPFTIRM